MIAGSYIRSISLCLLLLLEASASTEILVQTPELEGSTRTFLLEKESRSKTSAQAIQSELELLEGIPTKHRRLLLHGDLLLDDETLELYSIVDDGPSEVELKHKRGRKLRRRRRR